MLYPKIGIRPVIDGRWGGVRESLENQTMRMAENAAKLISENLKVPRWYAGAVRDRLYDDWRWCRGGPRGRAVLYPECYGHTVRDPLLVLWY